MSKPLIGITTYVEPASWGHWDVEAALVPYDYVRAVERAGGRAVLVPPDDDGIEEVLDATDTEPLRQARRALHRMWALFERSYRALAATTRFAWPFR